MKKQIKIILGVTGDEVNKKADEFKKTHKVINVIQKNENCIMLFYVEGEENEGRIS